MFNKFKTVIEAGGFNLSTMLGKIDSVWAEDRLTDEQRSQLKTLARNRAHVSDSFDVGGKLIELENRIKALEDAKGSGEADAEEYPEYVPGKWYRNGDKITYNGKKYVCTNVPEGAVCTWNPEEYPAYWTEIV